MGLMNDYICEAGNDETLQEDLDYIASSEIPVEALRDSKVLVTGATGLIGVSLVRALLCVNRVRNLNLQVLALIRNKEKAEKIYKELLNAWRKWLQSSYDMFLENLNKRCYTKIIIIFWRFYYAQNER